MNIHTPSEIMQNYIGSCKVKAERSLGRMFLLAILAGLYIAFGAAFSSTAVHSIGNVGILRLITGILFSFGLAMCMLTGAELFTGNTMLGLGVLHRRITFPQMLRNWGLVYLGNFVGSLLVAAGCAFLGQFNYSGSELAVYTIKIAVAKCDISLPTALVFGIFCNVLVCAGVLCSLSAKDTAGRILGACVPVTVFVVCGFEHCIANMYYIPAGIFAAMNPEYAALATGVGLDLSGLGWGAFFLNNLIPVTIGNIIGGMALGLLLCVPHAPRTREVK